MIDGNKIRCCVISSQYMRQFTNDIEKFCKGKQIIDIKYSYAPINNYVEPYSALITYYVEH